MYLTYYTKLRGIWGAIDGETFKDVFKDGIYVYKEMTDLPLFGLEYLCCTSVYTTNIIALQ